MPIHEQCTNMIVLHRHNIACKNAFVLIQCVLDFFMSGSMFDQENQFVYQNIIPLDGKTKITSRLLLQIESKFADSYKCT